jgi:4-amino-4-deoxy-L-arabinose transferase-like glycosyltransferase
MKSKLLTFFILVLILTGGGFLRFWGLGNSPPSVNWDEAALGYNAFSISQTGRDEYGKFMPIFTRSFDDYKSAIPAYLAITSIKIFGLNEVGVRLPSALLGTLSIPLIFFISRKIFHKDVPAFIAAFLFATEPYSVHFSRILFEANIALFFFLIGFLLFLYALDKKMLLPLSIVFFIISMYTYHSEKILVPLILLALLIVYYQNFKNQRKLLLSTILLTGLFLIPLLFFTITGATIARFLSTSIFTFWPPPIAKTLSNVHPSPGFADFFLHNQFFYFIWELIGRFLAYFSPMNLFIRQSQEPAAVIPGLAVFHPFEFLLWLVGLLFLFKNFSSYKPLVLLILLAPLPAVITWNWFHAIRVLPLFAAFSIAGGFGAYLIIKYLGDFFAKIRILSLITSKILILVIGIFGVWNALYLFDSLQIILPMSYFGNYQPGFKESIPLIAKLEDRYDRIIIESPHAQPYIFTLFYQAYPPAKYLSELNYDKISIAPRQYYDFGKYSFSKIYWPKDRNLRRTLFMGTTLSLPEKEIKENAQIVKDIHDPEGNIAVRIVSTD